ncbi:MAG: hypothetical protein E7675_06825 [Ruminococcaceae bacterium]|nr:hypothetical protein [Oscillospiraceae bacterium]
MNNFRLTKIILSHFYEGNTKGIYENAPVLICDKTGSILHKSKNASGCDLPKVRSYLPDHLSPNGKALSPLKNHGDCVIIKPCLISNYKLCAVLLHKKEDHFVFIFLDDDEIDADKKQFYRLRSYADSIFDKIYPEFSERSEKEFIKHRSLVLRGLRPMDEENNALAMSVDSMGYIFNRYIGYMYRGIGKRVTSYDFSMEFPSPDAFGIKNSESYISALLSLISALTKRNCRHLKLGFSKDNNMLTSEVRIFTSEEIIISSKELSSVARLLCMSQEEAEIFDDLAKSSRWDFYIESKGNHEIILRLKAELVKTTGVLYAAIAALSKRSRRAIAFARFMSFLRKKN